MPKGNFSTQSDQYAKYRPTYPQVLFDYLNAPARFEDRTSKIFLNRIKN